MRYLAMYVLPLIRRADHWHRRRYAAVKEWIVIPAPQWRAVVRYHKSEGEMPDFVLRHEVEEWLHQNDRGSRWFAEAHVDTTILTPGQHRYAMHFFFDESPVAVHFKLRWY